MADPEAPARSGDDAEDIRLMQLVAGGDTAAFESLIERHQALVAGTVARMLGSNADVEDITQQVFIRVWKSAGRYVARAKFTTWLLKITRNLVFNEMRRAKRHPHLPIQIDPDAEELPLKDEATETPDARLLQSELQRAIENGIGKLPEPQRMALCCAATKNSVTNKSPIFWSYRYPRLKVCSFAREPNFANG